LTAFDVPVKNTQEYQGDTQADNDQNDNDVHVNN